MSGVSKLKKQRSICSSFASSTLMSDLNSKDSIMKERLKDFVDGKIIETADDDLDATKS
jgi:hypothetical protein